MIDANVLRQLGWSDDLIKSVEEAAGPLRATPGVEIEVPITSVSSVSGSVMYSDVVISHAAREFTVQATPEGDAPSPAAKS